MSAVRHHTVSSFLLGRFARETDRGSRVCQLEKATGSAIQVSPRDATVVKHFYSFDFDGTRHPLLEAALGKVESGAAPIIEQLCEVGGDGLATSPKLPLHDRAILALFIATSRLRTPIWRAQTRSVFEQFAAFQSQASAESGRALFSIAENDLIQQLAAVSGYSGWVLCTLDWTFVRPDSSTFILGDTPVSVFDPTPKYPGSAAGVLSSPNAELFVALDPYLGLVTRPNSDRLAAIWDAANRMAQMSDAESSALVAGLEGTVAEAIVTGRAVADLNLRTYAHAQRYVYGSQQAVSDTRRAAKAKPGRVGAYSPPPPRLHLLEDDPEEQGVMRAIRVFEAPTSLPPRQRRS